MANWLDELKKKQALAKKLREELAQVEADLRDARLVLSGRFEFEQAAERPRSRHGFTGGKRAKPIQQGSSVWWAAKVLRAAGKPMHVDELLQEIAKESGETFQKPTLVSNLSRYVTHHDTFTRPNRSTYGLVEFPSPPLASGEDAASEGES